MGLREGLLVGGASSTGTETPPPVTNTGGRLAGRKIKYLKRGSYDGEASRRSSEDRKSLIKGSLDALLKLDDDDENGICSSSLPDQFPGRPKSSVRRAHSGGGILSLKSSSSTQGRRSTLSRSSSGEGLSAMSSSLSSMGGIDAGNLGGPIHRQRSTSKGDDGNAETLPSTVEHEQQKKQRTQGTGMFGGGWGGSRHQRQQQHRQSSNGDDDEEMNPSNGEQQGTKSTKEGKRMFGLGGSRHQRQQSVPTEKDDDTIEETPRRSSGEKPRRRKSIGKMKSGGDILAAMSSALQGGNKQHEAQPKINNDPLMDYLLYTQGRQHSQKRSPSLAKHLKKNIVSSSRPKIRRNKSLDLGDNDNDERSFFKSLSGRRGDRSTGESSSERLNRRSILSDSDDRSVFSSQSGRKERTVLLGDTYTPWQGGRQQRPYEPLGDCYDTTGGDAKEDGIAVATTSTVSASTLPSMTSSYQEEFVDDGGDNWLGQEASMPLVDNSSQEIWTPASARQRKSRSPSSRISSVDQKGTPTYPAAEEVDATSTVTSVPPPPSLDDDDWLNVELEVDVIGHSTSPASSIHSRKSLSRRSRSRSYDLEGEMTDAARMKGCKSRSPGSAKGRKTGASTSPGKNHQSFSSRSPGKNKDVLKSDDDSWHSSVFVPPRDVLCANPTRTTPKTTATMTTRISQGEETSEGHVMSADLLGGFDNTPRSPAPLESKNESRESFHSIDCCRHEIDGRSHCNMMMIDSSVHNADDDVDLEEVVESLKSSSAAAGGVCEALSEKKNSKDKGSKAKPKSKKKSRDRHKSKSLGEKRSNTKKKTSKSKKCGEVDAITDDFIRAGPSLGSIRRHSFDCVMESSFRELGDNIDYSAHCNMMILDHSIHDTSNLVKVQIDSACQENKSKGKIRKSKDSKKSDKQKSSKRRDSNKPSKQKDSSKKSSKGSKNLDSSARSSPRRHSFGTVRDPTLVELAENADTFTSNDCHEIDSEDEFASEEVSINRSMKFTHLEGGKKLKKTNSFEDSFLAMGDMFDKL